MITLRRTAALAISALVLTGCGVGRLGTMPEPSPTPGQQVDGIPAGYQLVTAEESQLRFAAPESWLVLDRKRLGNPGLADMWKAAADAMGVTEEQFTQVVRSLDVMVIDASGSTMNVAPAGLGGALPSERLLRTTYRHLNAEVHSITDVDSPVGTARLVRYEISVQEHTQHAVGIFVSLSTGGVDLTIGTPDEDRTENLLDVVLPSLDEGGAPGDA